MKITERSITALLGAAGTGKQLQRFTCVISGTADHLDDASHGAPDFHFVSFSALVATTAASRRRRFGDPDWPRHYPPRVLGPFFVVGQTAQHRPLEMRAGIRPGAGVKLIKGPDEFQTGAERQKPKMIG
ncbi:hypothetical protein AAFG13_17880 [Bradyrhizobium sp. B124]|uniref:hypothetical protein n=1 Tax=Bradyrhizobium sp. B124 TaxID=3140245 RepID=UPI0031844F4F